MCRITLLFLPLLLRLMTSRVLLKANFLFVVIKMRELQYGAKLALDLCTCFCGLAFPLVRKFYGGEGICRLLELRHGISE